MEEKNKPEVKTEQTKPARRYIALSTEEVNELIDTYRLVLKRETRDSQELLTTKIEELEAELSFRSKLPKTSK